MKRRLVSLLLALCPSLAGCGILMFEERHGQTSGRVDPNVVVMDGIGLLFFIVPGLLAFAIDLGTGAIYLPDGVERGEGPFFR